VHIVEQILADFKAGRQDRAAFWIPMHGRFLSIEYFALRGPGGDYLGTLEVSQDLTAKRALQGERRILAYENTEEAMTPTTPAAPPGPWELPTGGTLDARPLLAVGEHPAERVMQALSALPEGQAFDLLTPFPPMPLIDKAAALGFEAVSRTEAGGVFRTRFVRQGR
jgi:uncharacterized protein (DUF2249 family)